MLTIARAVYSEMTTHSEATTTPMSIFSIPPGHHQDRFVPGVFTESASQFPGVGRKSFCAVIVTVCISVPSFNFDQRFASLYSLLSG